jgi:hypothetical protein
MACAMRSLENIDEDNEELLQSDLCELCFQHMTDMDIVNAAVKQKRIRIMTVKFLLLCEGV